MFCSCLTSPSSLIAHWELNHNGLCTVGCLHQGHCPHLAFSSFLIELFVTFRSAKTNGHSKTFQVSRWKDCDRRGGWPQMSFEKTKLHVWLSWETDEYSITELNSHSSQRCTLAPMTQPSRPEDVVEWCDNGRDSFLYTAKSKKVKKKKTEKRNILWRSVWFIFWHWDRKYFLSRNLYITVFIKISMLIWKK